MEVPNAALIITQYVLKSISRSTNGIDDQQTKTNKQSTYNQISLLGVSTQFLNKLKLSKQPIDIFFSSALNICQQVLNKIHEAVDEDFRKGVWCMRNKRYIRGKGFELKTQMAAKDIRELLQKSKPKIDMCHRKCALVFYIGSTKYTVEENQCSCF